ncbi:MAG TPA: hypothetical protein VHV26_13775 [Rhizomicrobium sp.]|jgi:hypothetical protein|nr:hypothetical protein [Rhizomicrobium sp.]
MAVIATQTFYSPAYTKKVLTVGRLILLVAAGPLVLALIVISAPIYLLLTSFGKYL